MNMQYIVIGLTWLLAGCGFSGDNNSVRRNAEDMYVEEEVADIHPNERKPTATVFDKTRRVTLYDPYMQNAEVMTMDCLPGWQVIGRVDLEGLEKCNDGSNIQIKGSDGVRQLGFYFEQSRSYCDEADGVPTGQRHPLLQKLKRPYTTAEDYLRFVVQTQFPDAESVELKDVVGYDKLPSEQQKEIQKFGQVLLEATKVGLSRSAMGSGFSQILNAYPDVAIAEYIIKLKNGKLLYHAAFAKFFIYDLRMPSGMMSTVDRRYWSVVDLKTATAPDEESLQVAMTEMNTMNASVKLNQQYQAAILAIQQGRNDRMKQEIFAGIARNQRQAAALSRQIQENAAEISDIQMSMYESTSAMQDRVTALRSEAIREVNPYVSSDGTVVDIPIGSGTQVWSTSDAGTILSSDSYFFNPNIGSTIEYQEMQLLR